MPLKHTRRYILPKLIFDIFSGFNGLNLNNKKEEK